jgi:protein-tyrosine sulfotransferase
VKDRAGAGEEISLALDDPVVVLTCPRSGSSLLRLILDSHPELACPAETNIPQACAMLAGAWQTTDPASSADRLSPLASSSIRSAVDAIYTDYLLRNGKRRWCDKSLGTVSALHPFIDLYPKAKFICLYRHFLDAVDSGLEASPFGAVSYGYQNYINRFTGNAIAAIAANWCDQTRAMLQFEDEYPGRCHRVHYEEMVQDPENVAGEVFEFIGVKPDPGVAERCFDMEHDFFGPGDHKVEAASRITVDSVGRGRRLPVGYMPPTLVNAANDLLERLGYAVVDDTWKTSIGPVSLLPGRAAAVVPKPDPSYVALLDRIDDVIRSEVGPRAALPLPPAARDAVGPETRIGLVAYGPGVNLIARCWYLDLERGTVTADDRVPMTDADSQRDDLFLVGSAHAWRSVLLGGEGIATSLRHRSLRCVRAGREIAEDSREFHSHLAVIGHLLG